ncbi:sushi domain-containing protein 5 [Gouania willdenowi]|uniref:sushi domain-containing protein 5 n=1 Tax=Gouania willdenowi TaxID=441366 RepID=UPI0010552B98|nr:sushi domain-containing protein 5 [Gouania willdenowi]
MRQHVQQSVFGCLLCFIVISVVNADGRVFVLDLMNHSGLQGFREAEQVCASQHARLASVEELRHAVMECFFSPCTRGWLHGGTVGSTVCNIVGSGLKAVDVRTENTTDDAAQLNAFCVKDKDMPCGDPPSFPNARLQDHSGFEMGDELLYSCVPGYVMPSGQSAFSLLCDSCGEWYGLVQICVRDETESHVDYEDKFRDSSEELERHNDRPEEAHGEVHKELYGEAYLDGNRSLEQQETSIGVKVEDNPDHLKEHQVKEELVIGHDGVLEEVVERDAKKMQVVEDTDVISTDIADATEAPVSLLSQKHLFWFPSEAFQEEGPPALTNPVIQTTQRASGGESEESKEHDSQEGRDHQHTVDIDEREGDNYDQDQDNHHDSHHDEQDNHEDSHYNDQDNDDSHQHEDRDTQDHEVDPDRHDEHYDMGEHEEERDNIRFGGRDYDDPDDRYERESYEDHDGLTEETDGKEDEDDHDGSDAHVLDDHDDHHDHDDGQVPSHEVDDHDHDDHDSHEGDGDHQHVVFSINPKLPENATQDKAGRKDPTEESWLDGYPVRVETNSDSTVRPGEGDRPDSGSVVITTDRPNDVEMRRPVSYTDSPEDHKSPPIGPESEQEVLEDMWPRFTGTSAPLPELPGPSDSPSFADTLDYDTQQAAPTHSWLDDLTEHPIFDHGPAPPVHDDDILDPVIEEHTVQNLPGESGERGEAEGKMGETICVGEDCPPHHPSSSGHGPTMAAIIVAVCAIAMAVIAGVWCYHRRQRKSSVYEMNGKGQNQNRQGQHIEMQQKV